MKLPLFPCTNADRKFAAVDIITTKTGAAAATGGKHPSELSTKRALTDAVSEVAESLIGR
jgi:hypothetical protein